MDTLHQINRHLIDLRYSILDESELDELKAKKAELEKKMKNAKTKKADYEKELSQVEENIEKQKKVYDEERRAGRSKFKKKVYIDNKSERRPPYHFTWCRYSPQNNYHELSMWQAKRPHFTPVIYGKDQFCPESVAVNAANYYQLGDVVWVKCDLGAYLALKEEERRLIPTGAMKMEESKSQLRKEGADVPESAFSR